MPLRNNLDAAEIKAYMARDWRGARDAKRRYWRDRLDRGGLVEVLRVTEQLRAWTALHNPTWPTEQQRHEDLENHQRVAQMFRATAPKLASTTAAGASPRRLR